MRNFLWPWCVKKDYIDSLDDESQLQKILPLYSFGGNIIFLRMLGLFMLIFVPIFFWSFWGVMKTDLTQGQILTISFPILGCFFLLMRIYDAHFKRKKWIEETLDPPKESMTT